MPNWVYNSIGVAATKGDVDELERFITLISTKPEFLQDDDWVPEKSFSYHSFITLDTKHRDEYNETHGSQTVDGVRVQTGDTEFNWYVWNNANWGVKWDASSAEVEVYRSPEYGTSVNIHFESPWGAPIEVFHSICEQFPTLDIDFEYEEEQGWGAMAKNVNGLYEVTAEWDIPQSHSDYVERDRVDSCNCSTSDDVEDWYDDCPGKTFDTVYEVKLVSTFTVKARSVEDAQQAVINDLSGYDPIAGVELLTKQYEPEYVVTQLEGETV
jgi:Ferredoxin-like domain in Api92-like protein